MISNDSEQTDLLLHVDWNDIAVRCVKKKGRWFCHVCRKYAREDSYHTHEFVWRKHSSQLKRAGRFSI